MLSSSARPYIDASVAVLREHGLSITRHFYASMFAAHPELKNLFNMGNQASGVQQQSLAAAVFAYAANIDQAAALAPVIERIVHKHASVGITAAHYPIVGQYLLAAIQAILGEAASPALLAAWDEAYWLLAHTLIAAEEKLYQRSGHAAGEMLRVRVVNIVAESADVVSYYLQGLDGAAPGPFHAGQYISVAAQIGQLRQLRQYSLSDAPHQPWWRISVKRTPAHNETGGAPGMVSNLLHASVQVGDILQVSAAYGDFMPQQGKSTPLTLISGGIGITPMVATLNSLLHSRPQRRVLFIHAARDGAHHSLRADLRTAQEKHPALRQHIVYETPLESDTAGTDYHASGLLDLHAVLQAPDLDGDFYLCGPLTFMRAQWQALLALGVPVQRIHREVFGPELLDHLL